MLVSGQLDQRVKEIADQHNSALHPVQPNHKAKNNDFSLKKPAAVLMVRFFECVESFSDSVLSVTCSYTTLCAAKCRVASVQLRIMLEKCV